MTLLGASTALILAGRRDGRPDPLAVAAGLSHKCLVPVAGKPMIRHVVDALNAAQWVEQILISIDDPALLPEQPWARALIDTGRLRIIPARYNLVDSVAEAARNAPFPLMITTADNVHLTPRSVDEFLRYCSRDDVNVALALARKEDVLHVHPAGQRRFYRFSDGEFSNCNLYWLGSPAALAVAETFRSGGQFVKFPARIVGAFGLLNLIRFRLGIGSVSSTFLRLSKRFGLHVRAMTVSDGALAIDVDNERSYAVATEILTRRQCHKLEKYRAA